MKDIQDRIANLPVWAQAHIADLQRERDSAVKALNQFCDDQNPDHHFSVEELVSTGELSGPNRKIRYIEGHRMEVNFHGISLSLILRNGSNYRANLVDVHFSSDDAAAHVAMFPSASNRVSFALVPSVFGMNQIKETLEEAKQELYHSAHCSDAPDDPDNMQSEAVTYRNIKTAQELLKNVAGY